MYVDDLTLAGGNKEVQSKFWKELKQLVKIDPEEYICEKGVKILGRVHTLHRNPKSVEITYDMRSYAKGIVDFYCEVTDTSKSKLRRVSTPCLPESNMTDEEIAHEGDLHASAAKILMRCLRLSRLARLGLSFAVQRLASRVTRWTRWEDSSSVNQLFELDSRVRDESFGRARPSARNVGLHRFGFCILPIYISKHIWYCIHFTYWIIAFSLALALEETKFHG